MSAAKIALQAVLQDLPGKKPAPPRAYCCDIFNYECERIKVKDGILCLGGMTLKNRITLQEDHMVFAVCQSGGTHLTCGACHREDLNRESLFASLKELAEKNQLKTVHESIARHFKEPYPFTSFFKV